MTRETEWQVKNLMSEIEGYIIDAQVELKDGRKNLMDAMNSLTRVLEILEKEGEG